ncbi:MAG TPA: hypothetical protein VH374_10445 [Polyangia bacterium]|nr:hypothetical protein [Polyangia bacterium]
MAGALVFLAVRELRPLAANRMRILEARFHPDAQLTGEGIVVGRVRCTGGKATVEAQPGVATSGPPATMLHKLQYLVSICVPGPFDRLRRLRSRYWSFVEIAPPGAEKGEG